LKGNTIKVVCAGLIALLLAISLMCACAPKPKGAVEPVVFGLPTSLGYWFGVGALNGATMAVEEINAAGGINVGGIKRPIKLESIDTRDSAPGVPTADSLLAIEKLILEKKPAALVVAPNRSEVMLAALDLNAKYKMPQIGTLAKTPAFQTKVTESYDKYKYCFRITTTSIYMGDYHVALCKYLGEKFGFNKVFPILQDVLWARGTADATTKGLEALGWKKVGEAVIPLGVTDFSMPLLKAKDAGAQVIPIFFDMPEVAQLIDQWATMQIPAMPVGVVGPLLDPAAWESYHGKVEGVILHICEAGVWPAPNLPKSKEFFNSYVKRWGKEPEGIAGQSPSYDAVYVMKDAIERAGTLDPDAIVSALEKTDMKGAIGRIRFGKDHQAPYGYDPKETALGLFVQWQKPGNKKVVFPLPIAEANIVLPAWVK